MNRKIARAVKWAAVAMAFVLAAVMVAGPSLGWFKPQNSVSVSETEETENIGGLVASPEETAGSGISLVARKLSDTEYQENGIAPIAETAVTLTATLEPEYATDKRVDWSIAWKNAASEWATGKTVTDYVTVTPTEDGALTANVACLKAFAEQIVITVSARDEESDAQATCNVDYVQKYLGTGTMVMTSGTKFNVSTPAMPSSPDALIVKTELPKDLTPYVISQHDYVICKSGTYTIPLSGQVTLKYEMQTNISGIAVSYANNTLGYHLSVKSGKQLFNTLQTTFTTTGTGKSESVEQQRIEIPFAGPSFDVAQYLLTIFPEIGGSGSFSDQYPGYVYLFNQTAPHSGTAGEYEFSITVSAEFGGEVKSITTNVQVDAISMTVTGVQLDKGSIAF